MSNQSNVCEHPKSVVFTSPKTFEQELRCADCGEATGRKSEPSLLSKVANNPKVQEAALNKMKKGGLFSLVKKNEPEPTDLCPDCKGEGGWGVSSYHPEASSYCKTCDGEGYLSESEPHLPNGTDAEAHVQNEGEKEHEAVVEFTNCVLCDKPLNEGRHGYTICLDPTPVSQTNICFACKRPYYNADIEGHTAEFHSPTPDLDDILNDFYDGISPDIGVEDRNLTPAKQSLERLIKESYYKGMYDGAKHADIKRAIDDQIDGLTKESK